MLLLLSLLAHAAPIALVTPPVGAAVDGNLTEWTMPPSLVLTGAEQVLGTSKVSGDDDFRAEVWLAAGEGGLTLAVRVRDDAAQHAPDLGDAKTVIRSDHLEITWSISDPELPPIGYGNQFGFTEIATAEDCGAEASETRQACVAWHAAQVELRRDLVEDFVQQLVIAPRLGVARVVGQETLQAVGTWKGGATDTGWTFEASLPLESWPASRQAPIATVRMLVDAVDNDEGMARQESFLSSSSARDPADPTSWAALTLPGPVVPRGEPAVLPQLVSAGWAYQPAAEVHRAFRYENVWVGYQYEPTEPSPKVLGTRWNVPPVTTVGGASLWQISSGDGGGRLVVRTPTGEVALSNAPCGSLPRVVAVGEAKHLEYVCEGTFNPYGAGACGACPYVWYAVIRLDAAGELTTVLSGDVDAGYSGEEIDITWPTDTSVPGFAVKVARESDETTPPVTTWYHWTGATYDRSTTEQFTVEWDE